MVIIPSTMVPLIKLRSVGTQDGSNCNCYYLPSLFTPKARMACELPKRD